MNVVMPTLTGTGCGNDEPETILLLSELGRIKFSDCIVLSNVFDTTSTIGFSENVVKGLGCCCGGIEGKLENVTTGWDCDEVSENDDELGSDEEKLDTGTGCGAELENWLKEAPVLTKTPCVKGTGVGAGAGAGLAGGLGGGGRLTGAGPGPGLTGLLPGWLLVNGLPSMDRMLDLRLLRDDIKSNWRGSCLRV